MQDAASCLVFNNTCDKAFAGKEPCNIDDFVLTGELTKLPQARKVFRKMLPKASAEISLAV